VVFFVNLEEARIAWVVDAADELPGLWVKLLQRTLAEGNFAGKGRTDACLASLCCNTLAD